ncbi:MAG: hypothetical protein MJE68_20300 [Proteobacteria bacterium]|nr:hypothetical protein [Pseudomonadota bacterium]
MGNIGNMGRMTSSISWREYKASLPKGEQRRIARNSARGSGEIAGFNKKPIAIRILKRTSKSRQMLMMLEMARRELRMAEGLPLSIYPDDDDDGLEIKTSYRELLDLFPEKQQKAIQRGARLLQARYANFPAKYKTRSQDSYFVPLEGEDHMTYDEFLASMSKSERTEFFREIKEEGDRRIAADKKRAQAKKKTTPPTPTSLTNPPMPIAAKGK